jgi:hypothetical protein
VLRRIVSGAYGATIMTSKTLTWDLVAAALLMMAGGRANTQASPAHDPLAIWVSNNAFIKTCVDNAPCDQNPAVGTIQLGPVTAFGLTWDDLTVKSSATPSNPPTNTISVTG